MIRAALGVTPSPRLPFLTATDAEAPLTICVRRPALSMKYEPFLIEAPSAAVPARTVSSPASSSGGLCDGVKMSLGSRERAVPSSSSSGGSWGRGRQVYVGLGP